MSLPQNVWKTIQVAPVQEDNPCLVAGDQEKVAIRGEEDIVNHLQKENQED